MENENIRTIEINGIKMDIDLRTAKVHSVSNYRVGNFVKVLTKTYNGHEVKTGVIVGFYGFKANPTVVLAVLDNTYNTSALSFIYYNGQTKEELEILPLEEEDLSVDKVRFMKSIDREVEKKRQEIVDLEAKRAFFVSHFGTVVVVSEEETTTV